MPNHDDIAEDLTPLPAESAGGIEQATGPEPGTVPEPDPEPETTPEPEPRSEVDPDPDPDPKPVEVPPEETLADATFVESVEGGLTWVPYALYLGAWIVLSGLSAYLLSPSTQEMPARWLPVYAPLVFSGLALAALGPILSLVVWLVARSRRPADRRRGLLASALTRGALAAFFGVMIWIITLYVLELLAGGGAW